MENISEHLQKSGRFEVVKPKTDKQGRAWERADAIIEVMKFLHFSEVAHLVRHLEPHEMIALLEKAKKYGDKPKSFFRYLVNNKLVERSVGLKAQENTSN